MIHVHVLKIPEAETVDKPEMNKYTIKLTFMWFLSPPLALSPSPSLPYALSVFPYTSLPPSIIIFSPPFLP